MSAYVENAVLPNQSHGIKMYAFIVCFAHIRQRRKHEASQKRDAESSAEAKRKKFEDHMKELERSRVRTSESLPSS